MSRNSQALAGDVVFDLVDPLHLFALGIVQANALVKHLPVPFHCHIDVLVDGGAEHRPIVTLIESVARSVPPPAKLTRRGVRVTTNLGLAMYRQ